MSESKYLQKYALTCLRLAAECRDLATNVPASNLKAHFLRMAGLWTELALNRMSRH